MQLSSASAGAVTESECREDEGTSKINTPPVRDYIFDFSIFPPHTHGSPSLPLPHDSDPFWTSKPSEKQRTSWPSIPLSCISMFSPYLTSKKRTPSADHKY